MKSFIMLLLATFVIVCIGVVDTYAEGVITSPTSDKPLIDVKGKDYEGLINGFSSDPIDLTQNDADFYLIESNRNNHIFNYVISPDSTLFNNMDGYFNLMMPALMQTGNSNFEIIEIL